MRKCSTRGHEGAHHLSGRPHPVTHSIRKPSERLRTLLRAWAPHLLDGKEADMIVKRLHNAGVTSEHAYLEDHLPCPLTPCMPWPR